MKTTTPSPVSKYSESEIAFLKGDPLPEVPQPMREPWYVEALCCVVGLAAICVAWVAIVVLGLIFGKKLGDE